MKLEALWILINLSMCDTEEAKLILLSEYPVESQQELCPLDLAKAQADFNLKYLLKQSEILRKIDLFLKEISNEGGQTDLKRLVLAT